ncbi:zinc ribbon domain-containing protein [Pinibacter soli]|uniref:Zinc ribbon domain-containing protein n=1 Tax=Pinibacter soli TaxID=3044211 RepID=A0ABT6RG00_9BACT|nr:zinc ribbon domain-containing protein [Pinibacter soli]MDI3320777.1 zinc ribbon domain-containing protein [Pinibacter soli]
MECLNCNNQLPDKGFFCPTCSNQFKCKSCDGLLLKDAKVCIFCGEQVNGNKSTISNTNTIEFSETENSRTFKANFTDTVGQSISDSFGMFIMNKITSKKPATLGQPKSYPNNRLDLSEQEEAEIIEEPSDTLELRQLKSIFKSDGDKTTLSETRLKATSKRDYGIRLSIIFLYYKLVLGTENVPRKELTAILDNASVEDGNLRYWLTNNPLIGVSGDLVELKAPGKDAAKKYLSEIANKELKDKWQIGTYSKVSRKPKEKKDKK